MLYKELQWDSEFFGFKIASCHITNPLEVSKTINFLKSLGVKLIYLNSKTMLPEALIKDYNAILIDEKTTYVLNLIKSNKPITPQIKLNTKAVIRPYHPDMNIEQLINLAIQSGLYSRFAIDKKISHSKFVELYTLWIKNSLNKKIAEEVLVLQTNERINGIITLGVKESYGDIGLVAVDKSCRGKGFGLKLLEAATCWFIQNQFTMCQVITQGKNIAACKLYEKYGFQKTKVDYLYHVWLEI